MDHVYSPLGLSLGVSHSGSGKPSTYTSALSASSQRLQALRPARPLVVVS